MEHHEKQRLSETRGSRKGIEFFRIWYRIWGYKHTVVMIWFITFFYMLFDREAGRRVAPYIRHRFPGANLLARLKHTWFIFAHQGMALLRHEMYDELGVEYEAVYDSEEARSVDFLSSAAVILNSHFGPWQLTMRGIAPDKNKINVWALPDPGGKVDKMKKFASTREDIRQIDSGMNNLFVLQQALENDECITMMGDRNYEEFPMEVDFLGEKAYFPIAAFYLAARRKCPLICIFSRPYEGKYVLEICEVMYPEMKGRNREQLRPCLEKYTKHLEKLCMEYPYDCFSMCDHWSKAKNGK